MADRPDKDILAEARERLKKCVDDNSENRKAQRDDLRFCTLDQWPSDIRAAREGDVENGPRPCLTIDQINQYLDQVVNDGLQNKPAVKIRPVDDGGDVETAEVLQGLVRQIEDASVAEIAYGTALRSAVRVGEGYFRVLTEYEDEKSFNQVIRIRPIQDTFSCYLGHHLMPDGSDAEYGFIFEDIPEETFKRLYPKAKADPESFNELETYSTYWLENKKIRVAEYFYFDYHQEELLFTAEGKALLQSEYDKLSEKPEISERRTTRIHSVKWCKLTGLEILEKRNWAGKYVPIVKVIGKESYLDGARSVWGLVRPAKDSLRMYNYWASTITEKIALQPKAPFIMAEGQDEGHEDMWQQANKKNFSRLIYRPISVDGVAVAPPQRQMPSPIEVGMVQQLQIIREDVQASLGMYRAALGKEQPNQSGKAILALTRESDTGTFHFSNNQKISIMYCGRILLDLIPKIMDTRQVVRVLGEDSKVQTAEIDPNQEISRREIMELSGKIRKIYNLGVGTYDVTATVGPSYNTKRMEAAAMFTDLSNSAKDPTSAAVVRYLAIKNSDFNGATEAAEMMEKLLPPGIVKKDGQPQIPPEVSQQIQQMQQVMQMLKQENDELKTGEREAQAKIAVSAKESEAKIAVSAKEGQDKIAFDHDAKMKQLELDAQVQAEELKLAREKAAAEIEIKRAVAQADAEIQQQKGEAEKKQKQDELQFEKECFAMEQAGKVEESNKAAEKELTPQILKGITDSMKAVAEALKAGAESSEALKQAILAPKQITLQKNDNGITGATVKSARTLN